MKRSIPLLAALSITLLEGCAHPYTLDPITAKPERLNGIRLNTLVTKKCVLQAGYEKSTTDEMLIRVKVLNKSDAPFDIDASYFSLVGALEILKESPLHAQEPNGYIKELNALAEVQDARTKMESYQGIDELGTLKGNNSDRQIEGAKDLYREKQKDAEKSRKAAILIRKRIAMIEPVALKKTAVKSGESAEGAIILRAAFKDGGAVTLESSHPACKGDLRFMLRK